MIGTAVTANILICSPPGAVPIGSSAAESFLKHDRWYQNQNQHIAILCLNYYLVPAIGL